VDWNTRERVEADPTNLLGKCWKWLKMGTAIVRDYILIIAQHIVKVAKIPLQYMPLVNFLLEKLGNAIDRARDHIHEKIIKSAHRIIDQNEKKIRQKVVAKVIETTARATIATATSWTLRGTLGALAYFLTEHAIVALSVQGGHEIAAQTATTFSIGLTLIGAGLWLRCLTPTAQKIYKDHTKEFDPEASTLWELSKLINRQNIHKVASFIRKNL